MKTTIKILIPISILLGILVLVGITQSSIDDFKSSYALKPFDFRNSVSQFATDSIRNQPIAKARVNYDALYNSIAVESKITKIHHNGNTSPLLEPNTAQQCFKDAFNAYWSVFSVWGDKVFNGTAWDSDDLSFAKSESQQLKNKKGSENGIVKLNNYVQYVDGYKEATDAIRWASSCNNERTYNTIINRANKYSKPPYSNCSHLREIKNAPSTARNVWAKNIEEYINDVCSRQYDNYPDYKRNVNDPRDKITAFCDATGNSTWGNSLMKKIDDYEKLLKGKTQKETDFPNY